MTKWLNPITLEGNRVILRPIQKEDQEALRAAAADGELWKLWYTSAPSPENVETYINRALEELASDRSLPFVVIDKSTDRIVGSTRYMNASSDHRRLEIGTTWYAKSSQRTGINTECKLLLLEYAFEQLKCIAVEFRTHWHNHASRQAIAKLGAKQDGVLRNHMIDGSGNLRDTVVFSIIENEWPVVKHSLQFKLG